MADEQKQRTRISDRTWGGILFAIFCVLLVGSMALYVWLHVNITAIGPVDPAAQARENALAAVAKAEAILQDVAPAPAPGATPTPTPAPVTAARLLSDTLKLRKVISNTLDTTLTVTQTRLLDEKLPLAVQSLPPDVWGQDAEQLNKLVPTLADAAAKTPRSWLRSGDVITDTVTQIKVELAKTPPDRAALVVLFGRAKEEIAASGGRYFWSTGYWRWIELAFWAWFGVLVYLLTNIHSFFLKQQGRFKEFTPWYIATALRGPIIALLILFFLLSAQAQVFGISIALDDAPIELLVFLAGVLGFFSREAREVLEMLVSKIFPEAWARTHPEEKLAIETPPKQISLGESHRFKVRPERDVIWSSLPADLGEIAQDGTYTAPPASETDKKDKQVLVLATSTQNPDEYATVRVTLKLPPSS